MKLLGLIQKWGLNFEDKKNALPSFFSVYNKLRMNNVQFPTNFESNYQVYIDEIILTKINKKIIPVKTIIIIIQIKMMMKYFTIWIV